MHRAGWGPAVAACATLLVAGCAGFPGLASQVPSEPPAVRREAVPTAGPRDAALMRLSPETILRSVEGGDLCRSIGPRGAGGGGDRFSLAEGFACPLIGRDRTLWFLFADAWEAALEEALGSERMSGGGSIGEATESLEEHWLVHGDAMVGSSRVIGTSGAGSTLQLFVMLDLVTP
jgi:hypothetical protein